MNYKEETKETYNQFASYFAKKYDLYAVRTRSYMEEFLTECSGKKILDLGSGPGSQAEYMASRGFEVFCADISEKFVEMARSKGLRAEVIDMEDLCRFKDKSFDGVWSNMALLHLPKSHLSSVISELARILKARGVFSFSVQHGVGEEFYSDEYQHPGKRRWFSYYQLAELERITTKQFEIIRHATAMIGRRNPGIWMMVRKR